MGLLTSAVLRSGALDLQMLQELTRWKLPIELPSDTQFETSEEAIEAIEAAIESSGQVEVKATDLDLLRQFLRTQRTGKLHLELEGESTDVEVPFGITQAGGYIIPWREESPEEVLTNGKSFVLDGRRKVYFSHIEEFYFDSSKAFIVCTPCKREQRHHEHQK